MQPNYAPRGAAQAPPLAQQAQPAPRSSPGGAPGFNQFAPNQQPLSQPSQPQFQPRAGFPGQNAGFPQQNGPPGSNGRPAYPSNYPGQLQQAPGSNGRPGGFPGQQQPAPGSNGRPGGFPGQQQPAPGYPGGFPGQQPPPAQGPPSSSGRPGGAPIQSPSGFRPGQQQFSQGPPSSGGGGVPPNNQFQPGRPGAPPNRAPGFPGQPQPGMQPPPQPQPGMQPPPNQQPSGPGGPPMMNNQPSNNFAYGRGPPPQQGGAPQQPGAPGFNGPPGAQGFNGPPGAQGYNGPPGAPGFNGPPGARPGQPFGAQPPPPPQQNQPPYGGPPQAGAPYPGASPAYGAPPGQFQPPGAYPPGPQMQQQQQMPQQPQQAQQPKQRIDPTQIPRPIVSGERIQYVARGHTVTMPPAASSDFVCVDEGCCNPRFIRPTLNRVPSTKDIAKNCGLPLAAVICPLAELREDELPIPLVDFGPNGPLRCTRCAGYVNSFTKFIQGGRKFVCNLCLLHNETPRDYYCSVDQNGRRRDVQERAELSRGSVDYIVPAAYTVRPPQEPIFVFVLDVSLFSFQSTLAPAALHAIEYLLPALAQNKRKKIGIVTFDTTVHYYRMDRATGESDDEGNHGITMSVCPDIEDPPAPLPPSSWLVSMDDPAALNKVRALTRLIGKSFENTTKNQAVSGAALCSTVDALEATGGRVILLHAGAPRLGVGRVKREEVTGAYGTTKEVDLYTPEGDGSPNSNQYEALARRCADTHISLDVFSVANSFASLADIARVCELTGGRVQYMPQFEKEKSSNQHHLRSLLQRLVDRDCGYEAVLKIRCSAGLRVDKSFGNFYRSPQSRGAVDEMEFSVIDQDRSICVTLAHDETLAEGTDAYIQAALLYTRSDGIRCVRVHNLALPVEPLLSNVFRFADLDATCSVWQRVAAKQFCDKSLMRATPSAVKDQLVDECVTVLFNYRKHCAASSSSGQLILPESLKLLPLYTLATLKSRALRANLVGNPPRGFIDVRADERVMMMGLLNSLPVEFAVSAVYPKLYSLHDMPENCVTFDEDTGSLVLPDQLPPTAEKLEENGLFLLHSAMCCYLYIGPKVQSELLLELFGVEHADTAESTLDIFEKLEDEEEGGLRDRVRTLVEYLNSTIPISQPLEILTKNDWRANRFMSALVEDRTRNDVSYVEFLVQVHKKIQYKFH